MAEFEYVRITAAVDSDGRGVYLTCPVCAMKQTVITFDMSIDLMHPPRRTIQSANVVSSCRKCLQPFFACPADIHKFVDLYNVAGVQAAQHFWNGPEGRIARRTIKHAAQRWKKGKARK